MANSTEPFYSAFLRVVYSVEGLAVSLVNGLIVLVVLRYKPLRQRKEYWIMMAKALADMLYSLGFVTAGIGRTYAVYGGSAQLLNPFECFLKPHAMLWMFSEPAVALMMLVISCDRLYAVAFPLKYFKRTIRYGYTVTGVIFGYTFFNYIIALISSLSLPQIRNLSPVCFAISTVGGDYFLYNNIVYLCSVLIAILVYSVIPYIYQKSKLKIEPGQLNNQNKREIQFQKRLLKTMAISITFTGIFTALPGIIYFLMGLINTPRAIFTYAMPILNMIAPIDPIANFFIYTKRHEDFWVAVSYLVKCKDLPPNFEVCAKPRKANKAKKVINVEPAEIPG